MFSNLQEEMTSRVREGRRRKNKENKENELNSGDCEVFQCGAASLGHMAYRSEPNMMPESLHFYCLQYIHIWTVFNYFRMYRGVSSLMELGNRGKQD